MASGRPWTPDEEEFVARAVIAGMLNADLVEAFNNRFQPRGFATIAASRTKRPGIVSRVNKMRAEGIPPGVPEFGMVVNEGEIETTAEVTGPRIMSLDALLEAAAVDLDVWEVERHLINKWEVGVKVGSADDADVRVTPLWQVKVWLRRKLENYLPTPVVLKITRPAKRKASPGDYTSFHYSDIHVPHHDPEALNIMYQVLDFVDPQFVADHGDTLDCQEISRYPKDPNNRTSLKEEVQMGAEHCGIVHSLSPDAEHLWLEGNHEDRLRRLIWGLAENRAAGEILTLPGVQEALEWRQLLGIGGLGWETKEYGDHHLMYDRLILKHGGTVRQHAAYTAKVEHDKYGKSGMSGHTHRQGMYSHRDYNGAKAWWEMGLLGRIRTDYTDHANWQQGFAVATWSKDRRRFGVELVSINDGVAYFRGRRFEGNARAFGDLAA